MLDEVSGNFPSLHHVNISHTAFVVIFEIFGFGWGWLTMLINFEIFTELRTSENSFWESEITKKE